MPIESVRVQGVRGIRESITLSLAGKSLLLHGDNGTGKSSLDRALRWALLDEEAPSTDPAFTTEQSYRRHVEVPANYPKVLVSFVDGSSIEVGIGTVTMTGNGAKTRAALKAATPFLRRSELLDVLSSRPTERFKYFESFLGLEKVDLLLESIGAKRAAAEGRRTQLLTTRDAALVPLASLIPHSYDRPVSASTLERISLRWTQDLGIETSSLSVEQLARTLQEQAQSAARGDTAKKRARLEQLLEELNTCRTRRSLESEAALSDLSNSKTRFESDEADASLIPLLEHAHRHLTNSPNTSCPVCNSTIDPAEVRASLQSRLEAQSKYRAVLRSINGHVVTVHSWARDIDALAKRLADEEGFVGPPLSLVTTDTRLSALALTPAAEAATAQGIVLSGDIPTLGAACEAAIVEATRRAAAHLKATPPLSAIPALQTAAELFNRMVRALPQLQLLEHELTDLAKQVDLTDVVLGVLKRTRQDVAKETLNAIQSLVAQYYFVIHPRGADDDVTGAPSIQVQRHGAGSAFVRGEFSGKEVRDPQFVYSDGHLDTVGICIFLALRTFRAKQAGDPKIMVLDDIIVSIDLGHARRLIELLRTAFANHQILILTHNGLFAYWCKYLMPGLKRVEIKGWSLAGGPLVGDYVSAKEQLLHSIESESPKQIAMQLMRLLDEWAVEARYAYGIAVPAKVGEQYTLTEIWEPLAKQIKDIGRALGSDLGKAIPALTTLTDVTSIRNSLSAHENDFAREFPRSTITAVSLAALELVEALYCEDCLSFVSPSPNKTKPVVAHCSGNHKQYVKPAVPPKNKS